MGLFRNDAAAVAARLRESPIDRSSERIVVFLDSPAANLFQASQVVVFPVRCLCFSDQRLTCCLSNSFYGLSHQ